MPRFFTLKDISFEGKTALVRADLNVPMVNGRITDTTRLEGLLPTIKTLKAAGAKIVILSHFGRPSVGGYMRDEKLSLRPISEALGGLLGEPVAFMPECVGEAVVNAVQKLTPGDILVLENLRFHPEEEANDLAFAKKLAALGDIFVNDAFATAHRAHASTVTLARLLPAVAGKLMEAELRALEQTLETPKRPLAALIGGSKISTKLDLLTNLIQKVDVLVLGGGMANTFLAAQGMNVGKSLYEPSMLDTAKKISAEAGKRKCRILVPVDVVVAPSLERSAEAQTVPVDAVPADAMIFDIGPQSIAQIRQALALCGTILWNGPLGVFETKPFDAGTTALAHVVAELTRDAEILSVAGGGDTVSALNHAGVTQDFSYISTAGGAFLEWLEGKELPGVAALGEIS